jgi:hypothetical protein
VAYLPATATHAHPGRGILAAAGWILTTGLITVLGVALIAASVIVGAAIAAR